MESHQQSIKRLIKILSLVLISLLVSNCTTSIPDIEVCASGYSIEMGASCVSTTTDKTKELSGAEFVAFLEPSQSKAPALCMSSSDYSRLKTVIEQLCHKLSTKCSKQMKRAIARINHVNNEVLYE